MGDNGLKFVTQTSTATDQCFFPSSQKHEGFFLTSPDFVSQEEYLLSNNITARCLEEGGICKYTIKSCCPGLRCHGRTRRCVKIGRFGKTFIKMTDYDSYHYNISEQLLNHQLQPTQLCIYLTVVLLVTFEYNLEPIKEIKLLLPYFLLNELGKTFCKRVIEYRLIYQVKPIKIHIY